MDTRQIQTNVFTNGLNTDLHPLTTPNTILTDCINGTIITYNGNEFVLQNDMGNYQLSQAKLKNGYIPIGIREFGGILYIVSYSPIEKKTEIGSFPSPKTEFDTPYNTEKDITNNMFSGENTDITYEELVKKEVFVLYSSEDTFKLNPGDKYCVVTDQTEVYYTTIEFYVLTEEKELIKIKDQDKINVKHNESVGSEFVPDDENNDYQHVSWEIPGWLAFKIRVPFFDTFNTYLTKFEYSKLKSTDTTSSDISFSINAQLISSDSIFSEPSKIEKLKKNLYLRIKAFYKEGTNNIYYHTDSDKDNIEISLNSIDYTNNNLLHFFYASINDYDSNTLSLFSKIKRYNEDNTERMNYIEIIPLIKTDKIVEKNGNSTDSNEVYNIYYENFKQTIELGAESISSDSINLFNTYKYIVSEKGVTIDFTNSFSLLTQEDLDKFDLNIYCLYDHTAESMSGYTSKHINFYRCKHFESFSPNKYGNTIKYIPFDKIAIEVPRYDSSTQTFDDTIKFDVSFRKEWVYVLEVTNNDSITKYKPLITSELFNDFYVVVSDFEKIEYKNWISKLVKYIEIPDIKIDITTPKYEFLRNDVSLNKETQAYMGTNYTLRIDGDYDNAINSWITDLYDPLFKQVSTTNNKIDDEKLPYFKLNKKFNLTTNYKGSTFFGNKENTLWGRYIVDLSFDVTTNSDHNIKWSKNNNLIFNEESEFEYTGIQSDGQELYYKASYNITPSSTIPYLNYDRIYFYDLTHAGRYDGTTRKPFEYKDTYMGPYKTSDGRPNDAGNDGDLKDYSPIDKNVDLIWFFYKRGGSHHHTVYATGSRDGSEVTTGSNYNEKWSYRFYERNKSGASWIASTNDALFYLNYLSSYAFRNDPFLIMVLRQDTGYNIYAPEYHTFSADKETRNAFIRLPYYDGKSILFIPDESSNISYSVKWGDRGGWNIVNTSEITDRIEAMSRHLYMNIAYKNKKYDQIFYLYPILNNVKTEKSKNLTLKTVDVTVEIPNLYISANFILTDIKKYCQNGQNIELLKDYVEHENTDGTKTSKITSIRRNFVCTVFENNLQSGGEIKKTKTIKLDNKQISISNDEEFSYNTINVNGYIGNTSATTTIENLQNILSNKILTQITSKVKDQLALREAELTQDAKHVYHDLRELPNYTNLQVLSEYDEFIKYWGVKYDSTNDLNYPYILQQNNTKAIYMTYGKEENKDSKMNQMLYLLPDSKLKLPTYDASLRMNLSKNF